MESSKNQKSVNPKTEEKDSRTKNAQKRENSQTSNPKSKISDFNGSRNMGNRRSANPSDNSNKNKTS